jgi:hypothetical protein
MALRSWAGWLVELVVSSWTERTHAQLRAAAGSLARSIQCMALDYAAFNLLLLMHDRHGKTCGGLNAPESWRQLS